MNFKDYLTHFEQILSAKKQVAPYDDPAFLNYAKLNWSRMNRWLKKGVISDDSKAVVQSIHAPQKWILIVEPWCGDAAHIVPIIELLAQQNQNISLDIQLRDTEPFLIHSYLTNGAKAIPILIIRDQLNEDLVVWGPRPKGCAAVQESLKAKNIPLEELKVALQNWYNADAGKEIQQEIVAKLLQISK
jgi:hypothetical protein